MCPISLDAFTALGVVNVSKSERIGLQILIDGESLNAYEIWQRSEYKHYPTILRAVKKLNKKGLINEIAHDDARKTIYYTINFGGQIYYYLISNNVDKANQNLINKSLRFRELSDGFLMHNWGSRIRRKIYEKIIAYEIEGSEYNINSEIEKILELVINDYLTDIINDITNEYVSFDVEELQNIINYSKKFRWIYNITENIIQNGIKYSDKLNMAYRKTNAMLESNL